MIVITVHRGDKVLTAWIPKVYTSGSD